MTKIQRVVRTTPTPGGYQYKGNSMIRLASLLDEGYIVVMCTPIGKDLEYIVEKEVKDNDK